MDNKQQKDAMKMRIIMLFACGLLFVLFLNSKPSAPKDIDPSKFKELIAQGEFTSILRKGDLVQGTLATRSSGAAVVLETRPFTEKEFDELRAVASEHRIAYRNSPDTSWITHLLVNVGWIFIFFFLWRRFMMSQGKVAMSFGQSKAKKEKKSTGITFDDVAGCEEAKEDLQEVVEFLKNPQKFKKIGAKIPKGVLLIGPPGTGKTLLARAVAGEAEVPFFSTSGSEFVEMFVGIGASRVRDLFERAKKEQPSIVFIDELDSIGRQRFAGIGGGHDEREQTLNQILVELDGFREKGQVILIAATNRPDVLDPALLRPGRFDRHVMVGAPTGRDREAVLRVHAKNVAMDPGIDLKKIAKRTPGFSGADLANVVNEAALLAARRNKEAVGGEELESAVERVMAGPIKKTSVLTDRERKIVAHHESGHTLVARLLKEGTDPVYKVSLVSRGHALGYTLQLPEDEKLLSSKKELMNRIKVLLGGRVAEEMLFGGDTDEVTTGAGDDLEKASMYARRMVVKLGMGKGLMVIPEEHVPHNHIFKDSGLPACSQKKLEAIDEEVQALIASAHKDVRELLEKHTHALHALAARLLEKEELYAEEIDQIINSVT